MRSLRTVVPVSTEPGRLVQVVAATLNSVGGYFICSLGAPKKGDQRV
jgi:hypothetical protein